MKPSSLSVPAPAPTTTTTSNSECSRALIHVVGVITPPASPTQDNFTKPLARMQRIPWYRGGEFVFDVGQASRCSAASEVVATASSSHTYKEARHQQSDADEEDEVQFIESRGDRALFDFPHNRCDCLRHPFKAHDKAACLPAKVQLVLLLCLWGRALEVIRSASSFLFAFVFAQICKRRNLQHVHANAHVGKLRPEILAEIY
eukprot:2337703-Prymnesium_polylepis.1